jgi:hypothetical protein
MKLCSNNVRETRCETEGLIEHYRNVSRSTSNGSIEKSHCVGGTEHRRRGIVEKCFILCLGPPFGINAQTDTNLLSHNHTLHSQVTHLWLK